MTSTLHVVDISPTMTVSEALRLRAENCDEVVLGFDEGGVAYGVDWPSLEKMMGMNLGSVPVDAIAVPLDSPLLNANPSELRMTYDISGNLSKYFPVHFVAALYELQSLMVKSMTDAYVIGGITRDLILFQEKKLELQDIDVTIEGDALGISEMIQANSRNFVISETFPEFGTLKVHYKESLLFDVASTRKEVYAHCGALPDIVRRGVPLHEDIIRRDFTVNALALYINEPGKILDYADGIQDLEANVIRVLHPVSFFEDPSRILRAFKFGCRFGFDFADDTRRLMDKFLMYGPQVYKGGGDRIKYEMQAFLSSPESETKKIWLARFIEMDVLRLANMDAQKKIALATVDDILAASECLPELTQALDEYLPANFAFKIYLCFLFYRLGDEETSFNTFNRLGLTRQEREVIEKFRYLLSMRSFDAIDESTPAVDIVNFFRNLPVSSVAALLVAVHEESRPKYRLLLDAYKTYKRKWEGIQLELDGNDLQDLGVPEGPAIREMLQHLLRAKLTGRVTDRMSEVHFVQELLAEKAALEKTEKEAEQI